MRQDLGGSDFARLAVAGSGRCSLLSDPLPADLAGRGRLGYVQPLSRVVELDFYGECFFRFGQGATATTCLQRQVVSPLWNSKSGQVQVYWSPSFLTR